MNRKLEPVAKVRAMGRTTRRGTHSSADIVSGGNMTEDVWGYKQILVNGLQRFALPLPEEEVGVGARWEVTAVEDLFDLRVALTTTYEIVAFEGELIPAVQHGAGRAQTAVLSARRAGTHQE